MFNLVSIGTTLNATLNVEQGLMDWPLQRTVREFVLRPAKQLFIPRGFSRLMMI